MSRKYIRVALRRSVLAAARYRCGYCRSAQRIMGVRFHLEHIIPLLLGGLNTFENLCLACPLCNGYKGTQTHAIDPATGRRLTLFNPRTQDWRKHFAWSANGCEIIGQTPTGRATVAALQLNNEFVVPARQIWVSAGWHPPRD